MKTKLIAATTILFCFCVSFMPLKGQDRIHKIDQTIIDAKVLEISPAEIKYKKFSNPNGPTYTIGKSVVQMIVYENGEKDVFKVEETQVFESKDIVGTDSLQLIEELWGVKLENVTEKGGGVKIFKIEGNSIFKNQTPLNSLVFFSVKNGKKPVRVKNTSEFSAILFDSYNHGISKINLPSNLRHVKYLSTFTSDINGIDINGLSKYHASDAPITKLGIEESKLAGRMVSGIYQPGQIWVGPGLLSGMLFGLPGIALVGAASQILPKIPTVPPNVDADAWLSAYKSTVKKKRFITGIIGSSIGAALVIAAFSSVN